MQTIKINASLPYDVFIGSGILKNAGEIIKSCGKEIKRAVVVTDDIVGPLYAEQTQKALNKSGISAELFMFPHGEASKSHSVLISLYEFLTEMQITRADILVALGGGVVGDLTGFAAATYLRGIEVVQIPTTLLAQTDSSIGGKTAVDIRNGKNLVGAFKQPLCVIADIGTLKTLDRQTFSDGMSEIIKYGCIKSRELFELINDGNVDENIEKIVSECVKIKKSECEADEQEKGERMLLNFGHTLGHAIERYYDFTGITHGSAVAIGMCLISAKTEKAGLTKKGTTERIISCLKKFDLPVSTDIEIKQLLGFCLNDKKRSGDSLNLIVVNEIGKSEIRKVTIKQFYDLMEEKYEG